MARSRCGIFLKKRWSWTGGDELGKQLPEGCKAIYVHVTGIYVLTTVLYTKDHFYYGSNVHPGYGNLPEKWPGRPG
jgi:hypothetical protein